MRKYFHSVDFEVARRSCQDNARGFDERPVLKYDVCHIKRIQPMSRTPNSRKEETHERIVDAAARAIRRHGYAGVGVADVMKEAGLTHGGFYAHFDSRDALIVAALERAGRESFESVSRAAQRRAEKGVSAFRSLVETYLADTHLGSLETGCPVAALGCDMPRQSATVRDASAVRVQRLIGAVRATLPEAPRSAASVVAGTLVGSLQLARALGDNAEARAVLSAARKSLIQQYDTPAVAAD
jgi:TetR/AcrR family transcriptional regulator, transcriptional repressor for nem operon